MTTKRYCVFMIPAAHQRPPISSWRSSTATTRRERPLPRPGKPDRRLPRCRHHYYGGMSLTGEWLDQVSNLSTSMIALPDGPTLGDYGVTQQEAVDAASHAPAGDDHTGRHRANPQVTLPTPCALGLQMVQDPL